MPLHNLIFKIFGMLQTLLMLKLSDFEIPVSKSSYNGGFWICFTIAVLIVTVEWLLMLVLTASQVQENKKQTSLGLPSGISKQEMTSCPLHPGRRQAHEDNKFCLETDLWSSPRAWSRRSRCRRRCCWPGKRPCLTPSIWSCSRWGAPPAPWGPRTSRSPWWWTGWSRSPAPPSAASEAASWRFSQWTSRSQVQVLDNKCLKIIWDKIFFYLLNCKPSL